MSTVGPLLVVVAFGAALFLLSQPFWPGQVERAAEADALRRADLEAAKVAKYREIRDASLDHDTGKLSDADWKPIDTRLRAEAVAILDELDGLTEARLVATEEARVAAVEAAAPATAVDATKASAGVPGAGGEASDASVEVPVGAADGDGPLWGPGTVDDDAPPPGAAR